jgi:segregation and condensation protein B
MTDGAELEATIEAILFASTEPVSRQRLEQVFESVDASVVAAALERVVGRYGADSEARGIFVEEVAGGLRLATRPELHAGLRAYFDISGQNRLSMAALETLAIVAYRQPVTGPEIQDLRGVNCSGVLKTLLDRRLIRIAGRKQVVGKPFVYRTTREFLMHFGLAGLSDLPPLEEFEESFGTLDTELADAPDDPEEGDPDVIAPAATEALVEVEPAPGGPTVDGAAVPARASGDARVADPAERAGADIADLGAARPDAGG